MRLALAAPSQGAPSNRVTRRPPTRATPDEAAVHIVRPAAPAADVRPDVSVHYELTGRSDGPCKPGGLSGTEERANHRQSTLDHDRV